MVTKNGNGPFDLDYNLEIVKAPEEYRRDLRHLKDTIRVLLDRAAGMKCFSKSQDSTSCLTALLHSKDEPEIEFSFDVAIVTRNSKGNFCRLIHNKNVLGFEEDQYVWDEIPADMGSSIRLNHLVDGNMYYVGLRAGKDGGGTVWSDWVNLTYIHPQATAP